jgi:6-phosphogluconolactonase/glucosamine-6-phosphate isomerase/deaminase
MREGFEYHMARWLPFQDREACRKARAIKREEITRHPNLDFKIRVVKDHEWRFRLIMDLFGRIKQAAEEERKLVLILPQPDPYYAWVAFLCNKFRVSCKRLYTFDMDEYADQDGRIAPETWPSSFLFNMKHNFYGKLAPELRPPEEQIQGPTDANFPDYGKMLADLGGADVCYGGIGWCGHLAYIEPGSEAFRAASLEEWKQIGPRLVELTPLTVLQDSLSPRWGKSGDWSWTPAWAATIGPAEVVGSKLRSSWNGFMVGESQVSWQRFIVRLAAHGPVTPLVPASILQTLPSELYISESGAADIVAESVLNFSWW